MALPGSMTAVEITAPGGPEVLQSAQRTPPQPGPGEVVIQVAAAGVNRPDCLQRAGGYPPPPGASDLPGLEVAGTIAAVGDGVSGFSEGDAVCALTPGGGYAEYCRTHARHCLPVPQGLSLVEAATLPETFFTVWYNVFTRSRLTAGETFLVHGGTSGIGVTAIQLAKVFGATVLATAGSDEKCDFCRGLGADRAINYRTEDWKAAVLEHTEKRGVDVLLDMVAGDYIQNNIDVLATDGRYAMLAFLHGPKAEVDFTRVLIGRLTISGSTLRPQSVEQKAAIARDLSEHVWPLLESGRVKTHIHQRFPLTEAAEAHAVMESSRHIGKLVLEVA